MSTQRTPSSEAPAVSTRRKTSFRMSGATALAIAAALATSVAIAQSTTTYRVQLRTPGLVITPSVNNVAQQPVAPGLGSFTLGSVVLGGGAATLTPPASTSPGTWSFSSSDPAVATVVGDQLTPVGVGTVQITATQAAATGFTSASASATLTVQAPQAVGGVAAQTSADFGSVSIASNASRVFTFTNSGTIPATGVAASLTGAGLTFTANTCGTVGAPVTVAAGGTCTATVQWAPASEGALTGSLSVASSAVNSPSTLNLTLTGVQPVAPVGFLVRADGAAGANDTTTNLVDASDSPVLPSAIRIPGTTVTFDGSVAIFGRSLRLANSWINSGGAGGVSYANSPRFNFGTSDFTIDTFARSSSFGCWGATYMSVGGTAGGVRWTLRTTNTGAPVFDVLNSSNGVLFRLTSNTNIPVNTWAHIGVSRLNGTVRLFLNGSIVASGAYAGSTEYSSEGFHIGNVWVGGNGCTDGIHHLDEIRVVKGLGVTSLPVPSAPRGASGALAPASQASLSVTGLAFGSVTRGSASAPQTLTYSNTGSAPLTGVLLGALPANVSATANSCGTAAAPVSIGLGGSCSATVVWTPSAVGAATLPVNIQADNAAPGVASFSGTGVQGVPSVTTSATTFGTVAIGLPSAPITLTYSNTAVAGNISGVRLGTLPAGLVASANSCGTAAAPVTVAAGANCTVALTWTPTALGARTLVVPLSSDNGSVLNVSASLSGTGGQPTGSLTAQTAANFGAVTVGGGATASRGFTFTNTGTTPATGVAASLTGAGLTFTANTCGTVGAPVTVAAGGTCTATVQWAPASEGALTGSLSVASSAVNSPSTLNLTLTASSDPNAGSVTFLHTADASLTTPLVGVPLTITGTVTRTTAQSRFGGASMQFDGSSYLTMSGPNAISAGSFGTGDFTVEAWIRPTVDACFHGCVIASADGGWNLGVNGSTNGAPSIFFGNFRGGSAATRVPANVWTHIAASRTSGQLSIYINGVRWSAPVAHTTNYTMSGAGQLQVGVSAGAPASTLGFNGQIDELRITKGLGRYTGETIAVPTEGFGPQ